MNARRLSRVVGILLVSAWFFLSSNSAHAQLAEIFQKLFTPSLPSAVNRGLAPGGDLAMELQKLGYASISTMTDARAIVKAAKALPLDANARKTKAYSSAIVKVAELFARAQSESIAAVHLQTKGIPELVRVYERLAPDADEDMAEDLVRLLQPLAMYYTKEGTDCVINGVERQLAEESGWWYSVFSAYEGDHPEGLRFYRAMNEHLPSGTIAVALLYQANSQASADSTFKHPFNTDAGAARLKEWLAGDDAELAMAAANAIEHMEPSYQTELFTIAARHPDKSVRLQATFAQARLGDPLAFEQLVKYCLDVDLSKRAQSYLEVLEAAELIPEEASEPSFAAKAELSAWLADYDELGKAPDELRIIDQRELKWFSQEAPKLFTILEFVSKSDDPLAPDTHSVALVGSITWSFYSEAVEALSPQDIYALHDAWEAESLQVIKANHEVTDEQQAAYRAQWNGKELEDLEIVCQWKIDPDLGYPQDAVACATAKIDGKQGFAIFDGPRSHWYPADEFHPDISPSDIEQIHVGRVLLGFDLDVERTFTPTPEAKIPPERIVSEYQKWLLELKQGNVKRQVQLLAESSLLALHFEEYADALAATQAIERQQAIEQTFEQFMEASLKLADGRHDEVLESFSTIGETFEPYAEATKDDPEKIKTLIAKLEPFWDHKLGRSRLAKAAFNAGERDIAQRLLENAIEFEDVNRHRGDDAEILADIWHSKGKTAEAKELLIGAIKQCVEDAMSAEYDPEGAQLDAENHQEKYRELFPDSAEADLEKAGLAAPVEQLIEAAQKTGDSKNS